MSLLTNKKFNVFLFFPPSKRLRPVMKTPIITRVVNITFVLITILPTLVHMLYTSIYNYLFVCEHRYLKLDFSNTAAAAVVHSSLQSRNKKISLNANSSAVGEAE